MIETNTSTKSVQEDNKGFTESIQSLSLFLLPILVILPFYVSEKVDPTSAYYIVYSIYIIGSFVFLKVNRRKLYEIGLTVKNTFQSLYHTLALLVGFGIARFIVTDIQIVRNTSLIVSSVLFGAIHITRSVGYVFITAFFGAYWGYVTINTKNIIGPIVAHGLFNFLFSFFLVVI